MKFHHDGALGLQNNVYKPFALLRLVNVVGLLELVPVLLVFEFPRFELGQFQIGE